MKGVLCWEAELRIFDFADDIRSVLVYWCNIRCGLGTDILLLHHLRHTAANPLAGINSLMYGKKSFQSADRTVTGNEITLLNTADKSMAP